MATKTEVVWLNRYMNLRDFRDLATKHAEAEEPGKVLDAIASLITVIDVEMAEISATTAQSINGR